MRRSRLRVRLPQLLLDLGGVLLGVHKDRMLEGLCRLSARSQAEVEKILFAGGLKQSLDLGRLSPKRFWRIFCEELRCQARFSAFVGAYADIFTPIEPTMELVKELRGKGHRCYLLSNTDPLHLGAARSRWPLLNLFEGSATSFDLGLLKPDPRYFEEAMARLSLNAADCVFIDDLAPNVAAARSVGIPAIVATSPEKVRKELEDHISSISSNR